MQEQCRSVQLDTTMARLTLTQIALIKHEALITLRDKAAKEITAARVKVHKHNSAILKSAINQAVIGPDFDVLLQDAIIADATVINDNWPGSGKGVRIELSNAQGAINKFLRDAIEKRIKKGALKEHENVVRIAEIFDPRSRSRYVSDRVHCLASREAKYQPIVDEINGLDLKFALGADAAKVLADLKAKIAKL